LEYWFLVIVRARQIAQKFQYAQSHNVTDLVFSLWPLRPLCRAPIKRQQSRSKPPWIRCSGSFANSRLRRTSSSNVSLHNASTLLRCHSDLWDRRWRKLTRAEQQEFVDVFTKLLKENYLGQIKAYQNQEVRFTGERRDGDFAVVETRIVPQQGEPIAINYRLQLSGGEWKVYDVVIEDVSLVNNYRSQFSRVLARNSFSDLIRRMKDKE
jgi:hypothetical protein